MPDTQISQEILVFHGRTAPEAGNLVGYGALMAHFTLALPLPRQLALISKKNRRYQQPEWLVFPPSYAPADTLAGHLTFALKYEGVHLLFFKKLFQHLPLTEVVALIQQEYTGQYMRKVWFLYEWLLQEQLPLPDLTFKNYVPLLDEKLQYGIQTGLRSGRHRILNNLPGSVAFCPLICKTPALDNFLQEKLDEKIGQVLRGVHKDVLSRTSAFLLLKDSKASFSIEGEHPTQSRAVRWGQAIGQAGARPLSKAELLRLQQQVIGSSRFTALGYRTAGGFVGEHDRSNGEPIPDHISARWQDLEPLMEGLLSAAQLLQKAQFHPVLAAAQIAFGFVFLHPLVDGNGRLHRYLIHHLLAAMRFTPQGIIFPVSAAILEHITDYRQVLEAYSHPLLDFIEWRTTADHNVEVLNDTQDYYQYFDATPQAEFLFQCVAYTISHIIPEEVAYLQKYDRMKAWLDDRFQMPDKTVALLIQFLWQGDGLLSALARTKEFAALTPEEVEAIEAQFRLFFERE
ncbi:Fic family protein [Rufibacter glacialis]|uniref:Cell filamentation protein Fic n=1 Tax=Rufibacter glacialis TaxID=1259555 RepID=A0A5M8QC51_9BACT|nr:Fic family protein [Rufibacter glacialis]KAA6432396.1 cell filamentation protein Fic [Rufibacter glacialis]GGK78320.1 cell division protein Fic [Rufibacter glacialis]